MPDITVLFEDQKAEKGARNKYLIGIRQHPEMEVQEVPNEKLLAFPGFEDFVADMFQQIAGYFERSQIRFRVSSAIEVVLHSDPRRTITSYATYDPERSTDQKAVFTVPISQLVEFLYGDSAALLRFIGKTSYESGINHEMKHHLDLSFIRAHKHFLKRYQTMEEYLFRYFVMCRTEGFASYEPEMPAGSDLSERLTARFGSHSYVFWVFEGFDGKKNFPLNSAEDRFMAEFNVISRIGGIIPSITFSPYAQGQEMMRIIGWAKVGEVRSLTEEEYQGVLNEVKDLSLLKFYQTYFEASKQLGLPKTIFPKVKTLQRIRAGLKK